MNVNHDAIYGTTASPFKSLDCGKCTQKPGKLYLLIEKWPSDGKVLVPAKNKVTRAYLLAEPTKSLEAIATGSGTQLSVPTAAPDPLATVVVAEISEAPQPLE